METVIQFFQFIDDHPKVLWAFLSIIALAALVISAIQAHRSDENSFDLFKLFAFDRNNILSDSKARLNTAFIITSWAFVYLTLNDKLTEWYVAVFLTAWVGDRVAARFQKPGDDKPVEKTAAIKVVTPALPIKPQAAPDPEQ
jgi:hypothetical protein